jgi:small subunit ribosomal protein S8e
MNSSIPTFFYHASNANYLNLFAIVCSGEIFIAPSRCPLTPEVKNMPLWQGKSKRYASGARRRSSRKHRKYERGSQATETILGEKKLRHKTARGGNHKLRLLATSHANVMDKKTGKAEKLKIIQVLQNPSNVDLDRRGIITKGAIIETEKGKAIVTSRPGQNGMVDAVAID